MDNSINIYRYPLIQYKVTDRKASLVCLKEATEDIHYLLKQKKFDFRIGQEQLLYEIDDVRLKYERIQTWDTDFQYNMLNWIALNQDNYELYKSKTSLWEKIKLLEEILEKHIRIFMESMNAEEIVPLKVRILDIKSEKHIRYKDIFHLTFCINFSCNLSIPNYVGLGKGVSVGFGNVKKINEINFNPKK